MDRVQQIVDERRKNAEYLTGRFKEIDEPIRKIISDDNNNLWLTTEYNGIIQLKFSGNDLSDFHISRYDTTHGLPQLNDNYVHYINNQLIVATKQGIYKAIMSSTQDKNDTIIKFVPDTSFGKIFTSKSVSVEQICVDEKHNIWINSNLGIGKLKIKYGE